VIAAAVVASGVSLPAASAAGSPPRVTGVSASADDGNVPANTLDDDLSTRWSADGGASCAYPADVLDLSDWYVGLPVGEDGEPTNVEQPALATYANDPWLVATPDCAAVQFRAAVNGVTTSGSSYPRAELREMAGAAKASWSSTSGTHTMVIDQAITAVPRGDETQAAVRYGWGDPLPISDEFGYTGPVDPARWAVPSGTEGGTANCWPGHGGNGRRCAKNSTVADGMLTMHGEENGDTGWIRQRRDGRYGRWEIRSRSRNTGPSGGLYHPLHLIWPTSDERLRDGEYDWVEYTDPDAQCLTAFLHYPRSPSDKKERRDLCPLDLKRWHNFAFEWTPEALVGYVDGVEWFRLSDGANDDRGNIQDMPSGRLVIQLDNLTGDSGLRPAVFEVDWVRMYA